MILDNILRSLNQYMKDIFNVFGGESKEYMHALKDIKENLPQEVLERTARQGLDYEGDAPTKPLQLSRGKESKNVLENFGSDLKKIRDNQKQMGTVRAQSKKYYEDAENRGISPDEINIQDEAKKLYDFDNSTNDWYDAIKDDPDITDDEKKEVKDLYSDLFENYEDASFRDRLEDRVTDLLKEADQRREGKKEGNKEGNTDISHVTPDVGYDPSDDFGGKL